MELEATLGPIVGTITNNQVRILFECSNCKQLDFSISDGNEPINYTRDYKLITTIDLLSKLPHTIIINGAHKCSFDPVMKSVAIISCDGDGSYKSHNYNSGNKQKAWATANSVNATHAIHVGDQVYIDDVYDDVIQQITYKQNKEELKRAFEKEIRAVYRKSWFEDKEKHSFLASHLNFMMIDDHEIYDNFTSPSFDKSKPHMKTFLDVAARIAGQYQIGLSQDIEIKCITDLLNIKKIHVLENKYMKFVIVNSRLMKNETRMFDKEELKHHLHVNKKQDKLVVVDQVSPFVVAHGYTQFTQLFDLIGIDIKDHVTSNTEWIADYEWLFRKMCDSNAGKLVYVTGDLHVGQNHTLYSINNHSKIHCLTSSPISSNIAFQDKYNFKTLLNGLSHKFKGFHYTNNFVCFHNFVVISKRDDKMHTIS